MSVTKLNGHAVVVMLGETEVMSTVGAQRDCTLTINRELVETAATSDGGSREYLGGLKDWTVQVSGLYVVGGSVSLATYLIAGTLLHVGVQVGSTLYAGAAYVEAFEASGDVKGKTTYNATFRGTGELTR